MFCQQLMQDFEGNQKLKQNNKEKNFME